MNPARFLAVVNPNLRSDFGPGRHQAVNRERKSAAVARGTLGPGGINENMPHGLCGRREEMKHFKGLP